MASSALSGSNPAVDTVGTPASKSLRTVLTFTAVYGLLALALVAGQSTLPDASGVKTIQVASAE